MSLNLFREWFKTHTQEVLETYFKLLRFKSVSADPAYKQELQQCAQWLARHLRTIGMQTEIWETSGHPVLFAERRAADPEAPTLLIYHHYDVQPPDPLELWNSDPFEPTIKEGKVFARGAQDNKGQCAYSLSAVQAFLSLHGDAPLHLKIFIEGEEESGSRGTEEAILRYGPRLKADHLLVVDSGLVKPGVPGLTLGVRGIITLEVSCTNASLDLHSGTFGGIALNPNRALAHALDSLWDEKGHVKIPHFYDAVIPLSEKERARLDDSFDADVMREQFGINVLSKEEGFTPKECGTIRPTVEINGMWGGYTGEGFKTVLPAQAHAKISCRLVPNQDPEKIFQLISSYLVSQFPPGFHVEVRSHHGGPSFRANLDSEIAKTCIKAYEEVMSVPCRMMLAGGSIPIVAQLAEASRAETVIMGFGLDEDAIHAPNEHFGLDRFEQGFLTMGMILETLSKIR